MGYNSFIESTPLIMNGKALRERLESDGYLFIRGLIPSQSIMDVRTRLLNIAKIGGILKERSNTQEAIVKNGWDNIKLRSECSVTLNQMWCDEGLHRLLFTKNVLELFERIFCEKVLVHPTFDLRNVFPSDSPTESHQDQVFVGGERFCTLWAPLGDCPIELGSLALASDSHEKGILRGKFAGMGIPEDLVPNWITGDFRSGDALIFTSLMVHKALPNTTNRLRQSIDARYQPASLPITDLQMRPNKDSGVTDWGSVYSNWTSDDYKFHWDKFELDIIELDRRYFEVDYPVAFEMARSGNLNVRDALLRLV